jgi:arylsulfatase A-like enzyme
MRGPGIPAARVIDRVTSLLDVAPTLTGLALDETFTGHGRTLVPLLRDQNADWEDEAFAEMHGQRLSYTQRVLWRGRFKYVFNGFDEDELYDLREDPEELRNLAHDPAMANTLEEVAGRMWARAQETGDFNLTQAQDAMYRFLPLGPEGASES